VWGSPRCLVAQCMVVEYEIKSTYVEHKWGLTHWTKMSFINKKRRTRGRVKKRRRKRTWDVENSRVWRTTKLICGMKMEETSTIGVGVEEIMAGGPWSYFQIENGLVCLKEAPRQWHERLNNFLLSKGSIRGIVDKTLFIRKYETMWYLFKCMLMT